MILYLYFCIQNNQLIKQVNRLINFMTKNKIIVFANQKGGTGKSTLCVMMAHWLTEHGKKVVVYDADSQQTLYDHRQDDIKANPEIKPSWEVKRINALNYNQTTRILDEAAEFDGYVLIDAPGALVFPGLAPILQIADAVAIPFGYDYNVLKSTLKFIQVLMSDEIGKEKDRLFFIPNRVEEHIGTKEEKEQAERANAQLANLGRVTYRVKKGVAVQRYSTLTYTTYQMKATQAPWATITNKLSRLK